MSRGLGKWERYVIEVLTCQYIPKDDTEWEKDLKKYGYIDAPKCIDELTSLCIQNAYCDMEIDDRGDIPTLNYYRDFDVNGKCIYQSFARNFI